MNIDQPELGRIVAEHFRARGFSVSAVLFQIDAHTGGAPVINARITCEKPEEDTSEPTSVAGIFATMDRLFTGRRTK